MGLATTILVLGQFFHEILGGYPRLFIAIGAALITDLIFSQIVRGRWPNVASAYISGISIVILTKSTDILWPFAIGAAISILSKYVIAYKGRHLCNPTNFGLCVMLLVASSQMALLSQQWGNSPGFLALIWAWGLFVVWRAGVMHVTLTYAACFLILAYVRALITGNTFGNEAAPQTGPMQTLFMFFMITDPPTVVSRFWGRILVVVLIAILECIFRLQNLLHIPGIDFVLWAPSMFALFFIGPIAKWIDLKYLGGFERPRRVVRG